MQKSDENYFLDSKLLNNLKQSTQLQSQLKVFLYKDIDLVAAKNSSNAPNAFGSQAVVATSRGNRRTKRNIHDPLGQSIDLNNKELQEYLLMILRFYQKPENQRITHFLKYFLEDSANFFIIENYSRNRLQKLKFLQHQARQNKLPRTPSSRRSDENFLFSTTGQKGRGGLFHTLTNATASNISGASTTTTTNSSNTIDRKHQNYEQQNYLNFLDSSFNTNPSAALLSVTEMYDHNQLKREIKLLQAEKDALLLDLRKCLIFNYFYDHSELATLKQSLNLDATSSTPANQLLEGILPAESPLTTNANTTANTTNLLPNNPITASTGYSNPSGSLFPSLSISPSKETTESSGNAGPPVSSSTTTKTDYSTGGPTTSSSTTKANKHGITNYRIQSADTLHFLYLMSKYQYGKAILKTKKTSISSKSGEYLTRIYNLRMKTVNQLNWEIQSYELAIQRLQTLHQQSLHILQSYYQELKDIDYQIIKQSHLKQVNTRMLTKQTNTEDDRTNLKGLSEKLKGIIKASLTEIRSIFNTTEHSPLKAFTSVAVSGGNKDNLRGLSSSTPTISPAKTQSSVKKDKSPLPTPKASSAEAIFQEEILNTESELKSFSQEIESKMAHWRDLTLASIEKKKSFQANIHWEGATLTSLDAEFSSKSKARSVTVNSSNLQEESLVQKYLSTKTKFEEHASSLQRIHELNEEIRDRILQESEKNHTKYDYYLKMQQNQFQQYHTKLAPNPTKR